MEISYILVNFFSNRDEDLLVSEEFVLTKELGFASADCLQVRNMIALRNLILKYPTVAMLAPAVPKYLPT